MNQVIQPFDDGKFNFKEVRLEEVIFRFQETANDPAQYGAARTVSASPSAILINVSPVGHCHARLMIFPILTSNRLDCGS